jgi:hypothetical protein
MLTFTSFDDLSQLPPEDPARPIVQNQLESLITEANNFGHKYSPTHDGYIVKVDPGDVDIELDLFQPPTKLEDVFWEGTHLDHGPHADRNFFVAVFVPNNQFTLICVIENAAWLPRDLRRALCASLVPESI